MWNRSFFGVRLPSVSLTVTHITFAHLPDESRRHAMIVMIPDKYYGNTDYFCVFPDPIRPDSNRLCSQPVDFPPWIEAPLAMVMYVGRLGPALTSARRFQSIFLPMHLQFFMRGNNPDAQTVLTAQAKAWGWAQACVFHCFVLGFSSRVAWLRLTAWWQSKTKHTSRFTSFENQTFSRRQSKCV